MEWTDSCKRGWGGGDRLKDGEGFSQRTCMHDPWTWTTVWGLTVGMGAGWLEGEKGRKFGQL